MAHTTSRTTTQKTAIFRRYFSGLSQVYGTYDARTGRVHQVKAPVTDRVLLRHLRGEQSYGVYLLVQDRTRAIVADFDTDDLGPPIDFVQMGRHYGISSYIERSKSKGHHVWIFFEEGGVLAWKARAVVRHVLSEIGAPNTEVFPKHDSIDTNVTYGNFINAPLFGKLVLQGRTAFLDPQDASKPAADQWDVLEGVETVAEATLDELIELNDIRSTVSATPSPPETESGPDDRTFGLPPCARRMLSEGVQQCQRISCFRLAVSLKKAGLPSDLTTAALWKWAQKNTPQDGKRIITDEEVVAQTQSAYAGEYRSCGCEEPIVAQYCSPQCPLHKPPQVSNERCRETGQNSSDGDSRPEAAS